MQSVSGVVYLRESPDLSLDVLLSEGIEGIIEENDEDY
jgi:hypothetical protein